MSESLNRLPAGLEALLFGASEQSAQIRRKLLSLAPVTSSASFEPSTLEQK